MKHGVENGISGAQVVEVYDDLLTLIRSAVRRHLTPEECRDLFEEAQRNMGLSFSLEQKNALIVQMYKDAFRACQDKIRQKERKPILDAKKYIAEHYSEPLSLEDVAAFVSFSPAYFSNLFKQETGQNFSDYLTDLRISMAKEKLRFKDKTAAQIAQEVGYNDYS